MQKPTSEEVQSRFEELGASPGDSPELAEQFIAHYDSNGWRVGRVAMKNWKAACVTWKRFRPDLFIKKPDGGKIYSL